MVCVSQHCHYLIPMQNYDNVIISTWRDSFFLKFVYLKIIKTQQSDITSGTSLTLNLKNSMLK